MRFKIGETIVLEGRSGRVIWLSENANEIEAMDEYIVEFEDKQRQFIISSQLLPDERQPVHDREHDGYPCEGQTN